jgi:ribosomal protein L37AE/L43A
MNDAFEERGKGLETEYFRRQEQELIAKMKEKMAAESQIKETTFDCPKCEGKLQTGNFENIQIDVCDKCGGVWLDAGELQQITDKEASGGWFGRLLS